MTDVKIYIGIIGGFITSLLGGWDAWIECLCIAMAVDYATGVICALRGKSRKTSSGYYGSLAGFRGLVKKGVMLGVVLVAVHLDAALGVDFVRNGTIIAFIACEIGSLAENAALLGVPIPKPIKDALDILKNKKD